MNWSTQLRNEAKQRSKPDFKQYNPIRKLSVNKKELQLNWIVKEISDGLIKVCLKYQDILLDVGCLYILLVSRLFIIDDCMHLGSPLFSTAVAIFICLLVCVCHQKQSHGHSKFNYIWNRSKKCILICVHHIQLRQKFERVRISFFKKITRNG